MITQLAGVVTGLLLWFADVAYAGEDEEPVQLYSERPDILHDIKPQVHPDLDGDWKGLRKAHLEMIAQVLAMYPHKEFYFLARDAELLYDTAKLVTQGSPEMVNRLHLLNISRANMKAENVLDYLSQNHINPESLNKKKEILFIDTGFIGTIPKNLVNYFPENKSQFSTHLIVSGVPEIPGTRTFLSHINPAAAEFPTGNFHSTIVGYEYMPRYTGRSTFFVKRGDRWEAANDPAHTSREDGEVSKEKARKYMEDQKAYVLSKEGQSLYAKQFKVWTELRSLLDENKTVELHAKLAKLLTSKNNFGEAIVRDFIGIIEKNEPRSFLKVPSLESLGLKPIINEYEGNKAHIIAKYPDWAHYLEDPGTHIPKLIEKKDFQTLRNLVDLVVDSDFSTVVIKSLAHASSHSDTNVEGQRTVASILEAAAAAEPASPSLHANPHGHGLAPVDSPHDSSYDSDNELDLAHIPPKSPKKEWLDALVKHGFNESASQGWGKEFEVLVDLLIKHNESYLLGNVVTENYSQPFSEAWGEGPLLKIIDYYAKRGDQEPLKKVSGFVFMPEHSKNWKTAFNALIEAADKSTADQISEHIYRVGHVSSYRGKVEHWDLKGLEWKTLLSKVSKFTYPKLLRYVEASVPEPFLDKLYRVSTRTTDEERKKEVEEIFHEYEESLKLQRNPDGCSPKQQDPMPLGLQQVLDLELKSPGAKN